MGEFDRIIIDESWEDKRANRNKWMDIVDKQVNKTNERVNPSGKC